MPARSSPRHFNEMMRRLEAIKPGGETDIADTLHKLANRFKRRCLIVLISDLYDEPEEVIRALHHFRHRRHEVILFHVFDKAEIEFPFKRRDRLPRPGDRRADPDRPGLRPRRVPRADRRSSSTTYRRACAEAQIDYVMTDTSVPYDFMLSQVHRQAQPPMTFALPLIPARRAGRRHSGGAAHDQPPAGEGAAVSARCGSCGSACRRPGGASGFTTCC